MARRRNRRKSGGQRLILLLLGLSAIGFLLPPSWTGRLITVSQILLPFQAASSYVASGLKNLWASPRLPAPGQDQDAERTRQAAEHRAAALAARVEQLERQVAQLSASRFWDVGTGSLGHRGRLIPATVLAEDLLSWRSSRLVSAGSLSGIAQGSPVISREFSIEAGEQQGLSAGLAVLLGETLIGYVEQIGTHTSRVKLLSDVSVQEKVRLGRFQDDRVVLAERYFWLVGRGGERLEIRDVTVRDVESGAVRIGDLVLSDPESDALPADMTIGRVTSIDPDRDNPLFAAIAVRGAVTEDSLRRVYVFDPNFEGEPSPHDP